VRHIAIFFAILASLTNSCLAVPKVGPSAPFQLTRDEQQNVDRLLARWEQWNAGARTFDCRFKRWVYDGVFGPPNEARFVELGSIKYAAPDRCLWQVYGAEKDGKTVPIDDARMEHWAFDGKSIIEWQHARREIIEHRLPADTQTSRIVSGPLTFPFSTLGWLFLGGPPSDAGGPVPFSAKAKDLKELYYIRQIAPLSEPKDQIRLEAYPRTRMSAAFFQRLEIIFHAADMSPHAMKLVQPNGKDSVVYQFYDVAVNAASSSIDDPFHPAVPYGWQKKLAEEPKPGVSLLEPHIGAP
jgi:TIGR03009 family protein